MAETRTYHGITLDVVRSTTERICYILLPEGLKDDGLRWMEDAEDETLKAVEILRRKGVSVEFVLEENTTHFSPVMPRLEKALASLSEEAENTPQNG